MSHPLADHPRDSEQLPPRWPNDIRRLIGLDSLTIREWREGNQCRECGHCSWDPDTDTDDGVTTPCDHGCCVVFRCAQCGHYTSGAGRAGCPCDDGI